MITDRELSEDEARELAEFLEYCGAELHKQVTENQGWGGKIRLPLPQNEIQKKAMNMFMDMLQQESGAAIKIDFKRD